MCSDGNGSLTPSNLLYSVWNQVEYMAGYSQQDAHEFLIAFLNGLDSHIVENHPLPLRSLCTDVVAIPDSASPSTDVNAAANIKCNTSVNTVRMAEVCCAVHCFIVCINHMVIPLI